MARSFDADIDRPVVEAVQRVADERGVPMAHVALAWLLSEPVVSSTVVGATRAGHLSDAVAALDLVLTEDEVRILAEPYSPQAAYWW